MTRLIDLVCPQCQAHLPTAAERRVFVCGDCRRTFQADDELREVTRQLAVPRVTVPERGSLVLLPVWNVPVHREPGQPRLPIPAEIRVPAVGMSRMQLLINLSVHLSRANKPILTQDATGVVPEPAELTSSDVYEIAELVATGLVSGWPPPDQVGSISIPFGPPTLIDVPCRLDDLQMVDLVFGRSISAGLVAEAGLQDQREAMSAIISRIFT